LRAELRRIAARQRLTTLVSNMLLLMAVVRSARGVALERGA